MKKFKYANPLKALSKADLDKLSQLDACPDLDFLKAVEILGLDPRNDFRHTDLSDINFAELNLSEFDFFKARVDGCAFEGTRLPKNLSKQDAGTSCNPTCLKIVETSNATMVVLGHSDGLVQLWSQDRSTLIWENREGESAVTSLGFVEAPEKKIVAVYDNGQALVIEFTKNISALPVKFSSARIVSKTSDQENLSFLMTNAQNDILINRMGNYPKEVILSGHTDAVVSVDTNKSTTRVLSASDDGSVRLWDGYDGSELMSVPFGRDSSKFVNFARDGKQFLTVSKSGKLQTWSVPNGQQKFKYGNTTDRVRFAGYIQEGNIAAVTEDDVLLMWSNGLDSKPNRTSLMFTPRCFYSVPNLVCLGRHEGYFESFIHIDF